MGILAWIIGIILVFWGIDLYFERLNRCEQCGAQADPEVHGYNQKYLHCFECGWCTYGKNGHCNAHRDKA